MTEKEANKAVILWHSNAVWAKTGYGVQTGLLAPRLKAAGYEVVISAFYGLGGAPLRAPGDILVLPGLHDPFGNDVVGAHAAALRADLVFTLVDVWVLSDKVFSKLPWAAWTPVDHYPVPKHVVEALRDGGAVPIAMSKFGWRALREQDFAPLYVPHAVCPEYLEPVDRDEARAELGWEDKFVVGMVAANKGSPSRKCFAEVMTAFAKLRQSVPNALLYLHTEIAPPTGLNLTLLRERLNLPPEAVQFANPLALLTGYGTAEMAKIYAAMDVLANPSRGEGFGVPIIEAQACGTPVITSKWTAMPEITFYGWKVGGTPIYTEQESWQFMPSVSQIYDAMIRAHELTPAKRKAGGRWAREQIMKNYHPDVVMEKYMLPALEIALARAKTKESIDYDFYKAKTVSAVRQDQDSSDV